MTPLLFDYILPCLWAFLSCIGFCYIFNIQGIGKCYCGIGGAVGWMIYLLMMDGFGHDIFAALVAAMGIAVFSELMARIRHCPVTGYLQIALLPLVPGAGVYRAMSYCVNGETDLFWSTLLHTFAFAASLSIGAMLASSVFRALWPRFTRRRRISSPQSRP